MQLLTHVLPKTRSNGHSPVVPLNDETAAPAAFDNRARRAILSFDVDVFFSARHYVVMDGKTGPVHAHSFRASVRFSQLSWSDRLEFLGSARIRELIQHETTAWNSVLLNEIAPFNSGPEISPTIERIAMVLFRRLEQKMPTVVKLESVSIWDSPTNKVTYAETAE